uniref:Trehalose 6-phosphate phosphatase n=1 Tax=Cyclophora tenuis TaxID=216820 RepID=A0A7S1D6K9_CYCTE
MTQLCADPRNTVYVVSGDSAENVLNALGHVPGLGMGVSNGAHFSPPAMLNQRERSWFMFDLGVDWDAVKRVALPVLSKYTARSNGSFVKLTRFSIGWSYYSCDPEWGNQQASHLVMELRSELAAFDVRFVTLKGVVEIVPRRLNKGLFVKKVLRDEQRKQQQQQQPQQPPVDFILCMGDDVSDEKMFASVYSYVSEIGDEPFAQATPPIVTTGGAGGVKKNPALVVEEAPLEATEGGRPDPLYAYTVAVGKKPSSLASHWLQDAIEVGALLLTLTGGVLPKKEETNKEVVLFG